MTKIDPGLVPVVRNLWPDTREQRVILQSRNNHLHLAMKHDPVVVVSAREWPRQLVSHELAEELSKQCVAAMCGDREAMKELDEGDVEILFVASLGYHAVLVRVQAWISRRQDALDDVCRQRGCR